MFPTTVSAKTPRLGAMAGAAALLVGAGLAGAGEANANILPDATPPGSDVATPQQGAEFRPLSPDAHITASRSGIAGWKPVAADRLDDMRGGFDVAGLQVSFGIERAVVINGALVASTSVTIPDVSKITAAQAGSLAAALSGTAITNATNTVNSALASNPATAGMVTGGSSSGAAGTPGTAGAAGATGAAGAAANAAGSAGTSVTSVASAAGSVATVSGAPGAAGTPVSIPITNGVQVTPATLAAAAGQVVTNGVMTAIQNGPGNAAALAGLGTTPATVIQNTMNNQSIQNLVSISASVNTLQAFRSQVAAGTLNSALLRAASMR